MDSWLIAGLICVVSAAAEGLLAGSDVERFLQELKQPPWALRKGVEFWIAFAYYGAAFVTLWRLFDLRQTGEFTLLPLILFDTNDDAQCGMEFCVLSSKRFSFEFFVVRSIQSCSPVAPLVYV
jgi:hypothetical protein